MKQEMAIRVKPALETIKEKFDYWRETREKRTEVPRVLWEAAVKLTGEYSISRISRTLGLDYSELKRRVVSAKKMDLSVRKIRDGFVELETFNRNVSVTECLVELEDGHGGRMKMSFRGEISLDLIELSKEFWKRKG